MMLLRGVIWTPERSDEVAILLRSGSVDWAHNLRTAHRTKGYNSNS